VKVRRPRVRDRSGKEVSLESWEVLRDGDLLREWALNLMVLNVSTRKYRRAVRLPEGDLPGIKGDGTSKSAVSRRFVALSRKKMRDWLNSDLSDLDLLVVQIDGLHVGDHVLVVAIGVDGEGNKHVLAVAEGATENTAVVQALLNNLTGRELDPGVPRLFVVDGAKALSKATQHLRHRRRHSALPGPQGPQHRRAPAGPSACQREEGAPPSLGPERRG
jgi:transposase-like protein